MAPKLIQRQTELSGNIVLFCRYLRNKGYNLGPLEESDALQALSCLPLSKQETFKSGLRTVLAKNRFQHEQFDGHYIEFWKQLAKAVDSKVKELEDKTTDSGTTENKNQPSFQALKNWLYNETPDDEEATASYSSLEVLTKKDFAHMDEDELRLIMHFLQRIARKLAHQKSRLKKASKQLKNLDIKRTIRANMRKSGEIHHLLYSTPKNKKNKLVLLCDVSRSMELYSRFFIYLIYAFQNAYDKIETFVFSTAIHKVTSLLENYEFNKAFELISDSVPQWSGGTRIGQCFQLFLDTNPWAVDKKTIVLVLSDGWDTGEPEVLREAMAKIYKSSKKVIWLNPLSGNPNYKPEVTGIQTILPYVDTMAAAHNLDSLRTAMMQLRTSRRKQMLR